MSCVFIGDSLAVGTAHQRTECVNQAVGGRTTRQTIAQIQQIPVGSDQVIVSVGSNDLFAKGTTPDQRIRLYDSLRSGITAPSVVNSPPQRRAIQSTKSNTCPQRAWASFSLSSPSNKCCS